MLVEVDDGAVPVPVSRPLLVVDNPTVPAKDAAGNTRDARDNVGIIVVIVTVGGLRWRPLAIDGLSRRRPAVNHSHDQTKTGQARREAAGLPRLGGAPLQLGSRAGRTRPKL